MRSNIVDGYMELYIITIACNISRIDTCAKAYGKAEYIPAALSL
jgi:hypothetical protein